MSIAVKGISEKQNKQEGTTNPNKFQCVAELTSDILGFAEKPSPSPKQTPTLWYTNIANWKITFLIGTSTVNRLSSIANC